MSVSKEYLIGQCIAGLLETKDLIGAFSCFNEIYDIISESDFNGIEVYLALEKVLSRDKAYYSNEIIDILDKMFLRYSFYEIDGVCSKNGISRYECWQRFADVIYCVQPIFFHYVNEKEFMGTWNHENKKWCL